jgi:hypothetical protein
MWGRHLHAPEAVTGGPPSNPFPDRGCPLNGPSKTRWARQALSATSLLDSMNGRFQGPCGSLRTAVA